MVAVNAAVTAATNLGLLNGCLIDLSVMVDVSVGTCPSFGVKLPYGYVPVLNGDYLTLEKSTDKRDVACPTIVTVDPFNTSQTLSPEDTVNLQLFLGILDLVNVRADLQLDLTDILDLMVKLNINLLDLVNLDLDVTAGLGKLLNAVVELKLDLNVGDLLDLNLNLDVDLSPLLNLEGGRNAPVILGDILGLLEPSHDKAPGIISEILSTVTPVVSGLLDTVGGLLSGLLGKRQTADDVISMAMARRRGYAYSSEASPDYENGTGSGDQPTGSDEDSTSNGATTTTTNTAAATVAPTVKPITAPTVKPVTSPNGPTHPIDFKPNCGTCLAPSAPNVVEVEVTDLADCVNHCYLNASGGLIDVLVDAEVNVLNILNIDLCLAVSILGTSSAGTQTCRYITGTGTGSTVPSSAYQSVAECITYEKA
ncbi:hypothetical protein HOO65_011016 [Ceratocystis lukuohia]|uniref:Uncharacterized protein n=1 Tax=Ceratocystis lukuohia TaxID=2019550 RepID=A0ABR4MTS7_9PEZI